MKRGVHACLPHCPVRALRCFTSDPSIASSLKLLRKTPWAREKVEGLYLFMLREQRRGGGRPGSDR